MTSPRTTSGRSVNSTVALAFGAIYVLVGLAGFLVTGDVDFAGDKGKSLLGFHVNGLHNVVHLLIGVALIAASRKTETARGANLAIGATYLVLGLFGGLINGKTLDVLGLNFADHVLHLLSGLVLLGTALAADKAVRSRTGSRA